LNQNAVFLGFFLLQKEGLAGRNVVKGWFRVMVCSCCVQWWVLWTWLWTLAGGRNVNAAEFQRERLSN